IPEPVPTPRTRTVYSVTTITPTTPAARTRYPCGATLAWAFTVDTTTTISYSYTVWETTATATSTVTCPGVGGKLPPLLLARLPPSAASLLTQRLEGFPFGGGGGFGFGGPGGLNAEPVLPTPETALPAIPVRSGREAKRQATPTATSSSS